MPGAHRSQGPPISGGPCRLCANTRRPDVRAGQTRPLTPGGLAPAAAGSRRSGASGLLARHDQFVPHCVVTMMLEVVAVRAFAVMDVSLTTVTLVAATPPM